MWSSFRIHPLLECSKASCHWYLDSTQRIRTLTNKSGILGACRKCNSTFYQIMQQLSSISSINRFQAARHTNVDVMRGTLQGSHNKIWLCMELPWLCVGNGILTSSAMRFLGHLCRTGRQENITGWQRVHPSSALKCWGHI